jgi:predicted nuclease with TOPRIM domain
LLVEHGVSAPSTQLQNPIRLTSDELVREVQRSRGRARLTSAALRSLREEYTRTIEPAKKLAAEALQLEYRLHDLVNEAYGLTPEEVRLMWDTAPPRMPIPRPPGI